MPVLLGLMLYVALPGLVSTTPIGKEGVTLCTKDAARLIKRCEGLS